MVESPTLVGAPASRPGRNEALAGLFRRARLGAGARQTGHHVAFAPVAQDNGAGVGHLVQRWTARARVRDSRGWSTEPVPRARTWAGAKFHLIVVMLFVSTNATLAGPASCRQLQR